jgi:hypothetical protein
LESRGFLVSYQVANNFGTELKVRIGSQPFEKLLGFLVNEDLMLLLHEWRVSL